MVPRSTKRGFATQLLKAANVEVFGRARQDPLDLEMARRCRLPASFRQLRGRWGGVGGTLLVEDDGASGVASSQLGGDTPLLEHLQQAH
jgi:hypothetical protein